MTDLPDDWSARQSVPPVICYPTDSLPPPDLVAYKAFRDRAARVLEVTVPPREARTFHVPAGGFFRISCPEGAQVGDLNLWAERDFTERFFSGKTRALHGTHVNVGDRMWSCLPHMRPMATMVADSLGWYGTDRYGGRVHDVIGTRCDPYTGRLLSGMDYHHCCHSNMTRALAAETGLPLAEAESHVHDVLNVFMCTGFTADEGRYFMKASPARAGDHVEFFAEIALTGALSACPGGDCGSSHSSDDAVCRPLLVEVFRTDPAALGDWAPPLRNAYDRSHGTR